MTPLVCPHTRAMTTASSPRAIGGGPASHCSYQSRISDVEEKMLPLHGIPRLCCEEVASSRGDTGRAVSVQASLHARHFGK